MKKGIMKLSYITLASLIIYNILKLSSSMVLSYKFGAGQFTDAYLTAQAVPVFLSSIIIAVFICLAYCKTKISKSQTKLFYFIISAIIISAVAIISFMIFERSAFKLFSRGFSPYALKMALQLNKIIIYCTIPSVIIFFFKMSGKNSLLSVPFEASAIFFGVMASVLIGGEDNIKLSGILILAGFILAMAFNVVDAFRNKLVSALKTIDHEAFKQQIAKLAPVCISLFTFQIIYLTDRTLASTLGPGSVSLMIYSQNVQAALISILFFISISDVFFIKKSYRKNDLGAIKHSLRINTDNLIFIFVPLSLFLMLFARPVIMGIFERGLFDRQNSIAASQVLVAYSVGLLPIAFKLMLDNIYFSLDKSLTPLIASIISAALNVALNFILIGPLKLFGLAIASSCTYTVVSLLMFIDLRKKIGIYGFNKIVKNSFIANISALPACLISAIAFSAVFYSIPNTLPSLLICIFVALLIYMVGYIDSVKFLIAEDKIYKLSLKNIKHKTLMLLPVSFLSAGFENYYITEKDEKYIEYSKVEKRSDRIKNKLAVKNLEKLKNAPDLYFIKNIVKKASDQIKSRAYLRYLKNIKLKFLLLYNVFNKKNKKALEKNDN